MALKAKISVADYRGLVADVRTLYRRDASGDYVLDLEPTDEEKQLKAELDQARAELRPLKEELTAFRETHDGKSPDEVIEFITAAEGRALADGMTKEEFDKAMADREAELATLTREAQERYDSELAPRNAKLIELRAEQDAREIVSAMGGNFDLLAPHIKKHVRFSAATDDIMDGPIKVEVLDRTGAVRLRADNSPVTLPDLLAEWQMLNPSLSIAFADPVAHNLARSTNGNGKH